MGVKAYKIGSGELNNYPLVEHIAEYGKPMIVSTGMNDIKSVAKAVKHYGKVWCSVCADAHDKSVSDQTGVGSSRCDAGDDEGVGCAIGLSDHTLNNNACIAALALGGLGRAPLYG